MKKCFKTRSYADCNADLGGWQRGFLRLFSSGKSAAIREQNLRPSASKKSFTLIELLVVMAIISILAGLAVGATQIARKKASMTKTKAAIAGLEVALSMYELDMGDYPSGENKNLVLALTVNPGSEKWFGPYNKFKEEELNSSGEFIDAWSNPYKYTKPGTHNTTSFDIYSFGPNGKDDSGGGDDIKNW